MFRLWSKLTGPFRDEKEMQKVMPEDAHLWPEEVQLDMADIEQLVAQNLLVEIPVEMARGFARSFTVVEAAKARRRWILHPLAFNIGSEKLIAEISDFVKFPKPEAIAQQTLSFPLAVCLDFAWFYGHFETSTGHYMALLKHNRCFAPTTVATGARQPPFFAQLLTQALVTKTLRTTGHGSGDAYIDNVRFLASNQEELARITRTFFALCRTMNITVNEKEEEVLRKIRTDRNGLQQYPFLGMIFDHKANTVQIGEKTSEKLRAAREKFEFSFRMTWREWQALFGLCVFASQVLHVPRSSRYWIYKFMRKKAYTCKDDEEVTLWSSAQDLWTNWLEELLAHPPRHITVDNEIPEAVLVSDASLTGFGAILFTPSEEFIVAGHWSPEQAKRHINLLELMAVRIAIGAFPLPPKFRIVVDNTSTVGQLRRGSSCKFRYNAQIAIIHRYLLEQGARITDVQYIRSEDNPADFWSRLATCGRSPKEGSLGRWWRRSPHYSVTPS